jgi:hypothetical protein
VIEDFVGAGTTVADRMDLAGIDANPATGLNDPFSFIFMADFNGVNATGQLRVASDAAGTLVQGSTDADTDAEFEILVVGVAPGLFDVTDFVL